MVEKHSADSGERPEAVTERHIVAIVCARTARAWLQAPAPEGASEPQFTGSPVPKEFHSLLAWISCIADAQTMEGYAECLKSAGFTIKQAEDSDEAPLEMVRQIQGSLLVAEVSFALRKVDLPGIDFTYAKQMANAAIAAIKHHELGHRLFVGAKTAMPI